MEDNLQHQHRQEKKEKKVRAHADRMTEAAVLVFFCFSLLHGYVEALNCTSPTPESLMDALEKELFPKKLLRPVKNSSDTLNIKIHMTLVGILGVEEKAQSLTTFIWQVLEWKIDGLSWDEKECGTKKISLPREKLWTPDIHITEFMDEDKSPKTPYVYLYNTGYVYDDKPVRVVSFCHLDIYTFPFDVQNCTLTFGSYLHFIEDIRTYQGSTPQAILNESRNVIQTKGEWELADVQAIPYILNIEDGRYSYIKFHLILRRRPILYVVNLLIPSCFLSTLDLFSFLLPPQSVDRSAFKMTLILGYTVFLLIMNDLLPTTGNSTPIMNVLFSVSLALMVGSLLETVFITNIQFSSYKYGEAPRWLSVLVLQYLAVVVCFPTKEKNKHPPQLSLHPTATVMNANVISTGHLLSTDAPSDPTLDELRKLSRDLMNIRFHIDKYFLGTKSSQEWQMIALVIDRFLFGIYILFMTVSFITFIAIWIWTKSYVR